MWSNNLKARLSFQTTYANEDLQPSFLQYPLLEHFRISPQKKAKVKNK